MRKSMKYAVRLTALAAVVVSLVMLLAPTTPTHTPYASALSSLMISPAYAAGCPDKLCLDRSVCSAGAGYKCMHFNGKGCRTVLCG
jgi:hypothetical protein